VRTVIVYALVPPRISAQDEALVTAQARAHAPEAGGGRPARRNALVEPGTLAMTMAHATLRVATVGVTQGTVAPLARSSARQMRGDKSAQGTAHATQRGPASAPAATGVRHAQTYAPRVTSNISDALQTSRAVPATFSSMGVISHVIGVKPSVKRKASPTLVDKRISSACAATPTAHRAPRWGAIVRRNPVLRLGIIRVVFIRSYQLKARARGMVFATTMVTANARQNGSERSVISSAQAPACRMLPKCAAATAPATTRGGADVPQGTGVSAVRSSAPVHQVISARAMAHAVTVAIVCAVQGIVAGTAPSNAPR